MVVDAFDKPRIEPNGKVGNASATFIGIEKLIDERKRKVCPCFCVLIIKPAVNGSVSKLVECLHKLLGVPASMCGAANKPEDFPMAEGDRFGCRIPVVGELLENGLEHLIRKHRRLAVIAIRDDLDGLFIVDFRAL